MRDNNSSFGNMLFLPNENITRFNKRDVLYDSIEIPRFVMLHLVFLQQFLRTTNTLMTNFGIFADLTRVNLGHSTKLPHT